jgi:hypothetical protein
MNRTTILCALACGSMGIQAALGQSLLSQAERLQPPAGAAAPFATAPAGGGYMGYTPKDGPEDGRGIQVETVKPGAPAALGGLKDGDLITAVNGKPMTLEQFDHHLAVTPPGQRVQLTVNRGGRTQQLTVMLGTKPAPGTSAATTPAESSFSSPSLTPPSNPATIAPPPAGSFSAPGISPDPSGTPSLSPPSSPGAADTTAPSLTPPATSDSLPGSGAFSTPAPAESSPRSIRAQPLELGSPPGTTSDPDPAGARSGSPVPGGVGSSGGASLGIRVLPLTEEARARAGVPVRRGALIEDVKRGSAAEQAGLPVGGVIVRMGSREVNSADDLVAAVQAARPGQEVEVMYYDRSRPYRKVVTLASAGGGEGGTAEARSGSSVAAPPASGVPATGESSLRGAPGALGNRPLLRNLGQMAADTIGRPGGLSTVYDPSVVAALQDRVAELTAQTQQLEERIRALESRSGGSAITPGGASTTPSLTPPASTTPPPSSFGTPSGPGFGPALGTGTGP